MPTPTLQIAPGTYSLDAIHSTVGFSLQHLVVSKFRGSFGGFDASLTVAEDGAISLTGSVDVPSVEVKDPNLVGHLQAPDFFDTQQFPKATFTSTGVREDGGDVVVDGELTIKGNTHAVEGRGSITFIEADLQGSPRVGVDLSTVIDRQAYGLAFNAQLPNGGAALENDVTIHVELEFVPAS